MNKLTINECFQNVLNLLYESRQEKLPLELLRALESYKMDRCHLADKDHMEDDRVYMHVGHRARVICYSKYCEELPIENINGIILHEIGHILHERFHLKHYLPTRDHEIIADYMIDYYFSGLRIWYDENKIQIVF